MSGFRVDSTAFHASIRQLSKLNGKTQGETLLSFAKTTLRNRDGSGLIDITPPASSKTNASAARKQGIGAIRRDVNRIFAGVDLRRKTRVEKHPDVEGIHRKHFLGKRGSNRLSSHLGKQKYFVDRKKLSALVKKLESHVGRFASGWAAAANRLGVSIPAWIGRHGTSRGGVMVNLTAPKYFVEMSLNAPPNSPDAELERRVRYALNYTQGRLDRAIAGTIAANARKAGLKAA